MWRMTQLSIDHSEPPESDRVNLTTASHACHREKQQERRMYRRGKKILALENFRGGGWGSVAVTSRLMASVAVTRTKVTI